MSFNLVEGVTAEDLSGISSAYVLKDNLLDSVISAELIGPLLKNIIDKLDEPQFFFIELPCTEEEEKQFKSDNSAFQHYKVYYLDGCTRPVSLTILKRYGELLINDGLTRFGFGSNKTNDEVYVQDYQSVQVYGLTKLFEPAFRKLGIEKTEELRTLWDNFSYETPGMCSSVEIEEHIPGVS